MANDLILEEERMGILEDEMSDAENAVADILCDPEILDPLPDDFFDKSVDELNKYFGGHDETVVTEKVREYCKLFKHYTDDLRDEMDSSAQEYEKARKDSMDEDLKDFSLTEGERRFVDNVMEEDIGYFPKGFFDGGVTDEIRGMFEGFDGDLTDKSLKAIGKLVLNKPLA